MKKIVIIFCFLFVSCNSQVYNDNAVSIISCKKELQDGVYQYCIIRIFEGYSYDAGYFYTIEEFQVGDKIKICKK